MIDELPQSQVSQLNNFSQEFICRLLLNYGIYCFIFVFLSKSFRWKNCTHIMKMFVVASLHANLYSVEWQFSFIGRGTCQCKNEGIPLKRKNFPVPTYRKTICSCIEGTFSDGYIARLSVNYVVVSVSLVVSSFLKVKARSG